MPNPSSKQELIAAMTDGYAKLNEQIAKMSDGYAKLNEQIAKMSEEAMSAPFDFAADPKKCGVRWQYDRCLRDLLIHLHEWQVLMREFVNNIREGHPRDYLPDEYRKNYHEMDNYKNTYTTDMAAYFVSVTSSPYGQAVKLLKTHQKNLKK